MRTFSALLFVVVLSGCGTSPVIPDLVAPAELASFDPADGAEPTSGIVSVDEQGLTITTNGRARYNSLVDEYGHEFVPRIKKDYGVSPLEGGFYFLNNAGFEKWGIMAEWRKMGRQPN